PLKSRVAMVGLLAGWPPRCKPLISKAGLEWSLKLLGVHAPDVVGPVGVRRVGPVDLAGGSENHARAVGRPLRLKAIRPKCSGIGERGGACAIRAAPDVGGAVSVRRVGPVELPPRREHNPRAVGRPLR